MRNESGGPAPDRYADRRRAPRVEVHSRMRGELASQGAPIALLNLSEGGFLMQSPIELSVGTVEEFRLTTSVGAVVMIRARVVHEIRVTSGDAVSYVIGLEFVDRHEQAINELISLLQR